MSKTPSFVRLPSSFQHPRAHSSSHGFTLTELLVVIATLGILAVLMAPALAANHSSGPALQCLADMKRLQLASQLYASDNNGYLPGTLPTSAQGYYTGTTIPSSVYPSWVAGTMGWDSTPPESGAADYPAGCSTNAYFLGVYGNKIPGAAAGTLIGSIGGYAQTASVYKCPADKTIDSLYHVPRVRDCSANCFVGVNANWASVNSTAANAWLPTAYKRFYKYSDFIASKLSAAQCFVFLDESPMSCNDGFFLFIASGTSLNDLPGANHGNSSSFSFADGHAELHQWVDAVLSPSSSGTNDARWLASHGTCPN